jgi:hypothetical protein
MNLFPRKIVTMTFSTVFLSLILSGCSGQGASSKIANPIQNPSGFLPDYALLQPVPDAPKNTEIYNYKAPDLKPGDYRSMIINPVIIYNTASNQGVSENNIENARASIQAGIEKIVSQKVSLTQTEGPGVAELTVAITGAMLEGESLKPRDFIPISAAINLASKAVGKEQKIPAIVVELKIVDSTHGNLLREIVTVIHGEAFRDKTNTSQEFQVLAESWVKDAMDYSASH